MGFVALHEADLSDKMQANLSLLQHTQNLNKLCINQDYSSYTFITSSVGTEAATQHILSCYIYEDKGDYGGQPDTLHGS